MDQNYPLSWEKILIIYNWYFIPKIESDCDFGTKVLNKILFMICIDPKGPEGS